MVKRKILEWKYLGCVNTLLGSTNDRVYLFTVRKLKISESNPEATEILNTKWVTEEQFWRMVQRGDITDVTSIATLAIGKAKK